MNDSEMFAFNTAFQGLRRVFHLRGEDHEIQQTMTAYFKALRRFTLGQVQAGAKLCLQRCKHFPKPAEWMEACPRPSYVGTPVSVMTEMQAHDYARAERLCYEDEPCACALCTAADVHWKPIRFVPEFNDDERDRKVRDPLRDRIVTAGHWAHGEELARWYAAKSAFYDQVARLGLSRNILAPKETA